MSDKRVGRPSITDYTTDTPKTACIRVSGQEYRTLMIRAIKKGLSLSEYMRWVLLREHK